MVGSGNEWPGPPSQDSNVSTPLAANRLTASAIPGSSRRQSMPSGNVDRRSGANSVSKGMVKTDMLLRGNNTASFVPGTLHWPERFPQTTYSDTVDDLRPADGEPTRGERPVIDASLLLNPEYQDPELRAYAFLSTQYKVGVRSPLDCLQPFVIYAISAHIDLQLDWSLVRNYLKTKYSLSVPFYMLERMQSRLLEAGALAQTNISRVLLCKDARPSMTGKTIDFSLADIEQLGIALAQFAERRGMAAPATAGRWADIIVPFFLHSSPPADKATATVRGVMVSDPKSIDFAIVADFIMEQYRSLSATYKTIERLYYGVLAANFLTQIETAGDKASFKGLGIIYDTPVILRLLGCSGKVLKEATDDLHDTLRELGCRTYYFHHTYEEVASSIEAMLKCYENGAPLFRETQEALVRGDIKIADIYRVRTELDLRLAALGITEHGMGYTDRKSDEFQINEHKFKNHLERNRRWGAEGSQAADRDAMSLAVVMRLRNGAHVREVAKAGYIFVTHNPSLATRAKDFLRQEGQLEDGTVWPIMTVGQLSTIAWVVNEVFQDDRRVTNELIADCYAAALPDEDFDEKLKELLIKMDPMKAHELYTNAFIAGSIRQVALEQTGGHSALVRTLSPAQLLTEADAVRERVVKEARQEERAATEQAMTERESHRLVSKAARISSFSARSIMAVLVLAASFAFVLDTGLFGERWSKGFIVPALIALFGIYGAFDVGGVVRSASVRKALDLGILWAIRRLQRLLA